jgi:hypothetical protein
VQDNSGPFSLWLAATTATAATCRGLPGHRYSFYSLATDNAGNAEAAKIVVDTATTCTNGTGDWRFIVALANADKTDIQFGMHPEATDDFNAGLDLASAEAPASGPLGGACFFTGVRTLYARDLRAVADAAKWLLAVVANDQPVTLSWEAGNVPPGRYLSIYQTTTGDGAQEISGSRLDMNEAHDIIVPAHTPNWFVIEYSAAPPPFTLGLNPGWNLISLPLVPDPAAVSAIFADMRNGGDTLAPAPRAEPDTGDRGLVVNGNAWSWVPGSPGHYATVPALTALTGYWVFANGQADVVVLGTAPATTTVTLVPGWNLVGPAASVPAPTHAAIRLPLWRRNAVTGECAMVQDRELLTPGVGYWIYATGTATVNLGR